MFKTLLTFLIIYWIWKFLTKLTQPLRPQNPFSAQRPTPPPALGVSELVKDPICETYIDKTTAISSNGYYFCSEGCLTQFKERP